MSEKMWHETWSGYGKPPEQNEVVAIEYQDDRPFSVLTRNHWEHGGKSGISADYWSFEWCERDGLLYYNCNGSGPFRGMIVNGYHRPDPPPAKLWLASGVQCIDGGLKETTILQGQLLSMGYVLIDHPLLLNDKHPNPFAVGIERDCIYCPLCGDWLPDDGVCQHVFWCDECGDWYYRESKENLDDSEDKCEHTDEI